MLIKKGIVVGAIMGTLTAILCLSLEVIRPFSTDVNALVDSVTDPLCPLFVLRFMNLVSTMWAVYAITIVGNAVVYGIAGGLIAAIIFAFKRILS